MNIINRIFKGFGLAATLAAFLTMTVACTDDLLNDGVIRQNSDGTYGPFDLEVSFDAEANESHSRATFSTDNFELDCAWVAMFTAKTGRLVAMAESSPETFGGTPGTNHADGVGDNHKVILRSLMLSDENDEVYIAGVANYEGIKAIDPHGNEVSLIEALRNINDIKEYKNISIQTASAEQAIQYANKPLLSGFWGEGHGNYTVNQSGVVYADQDRVFKVKMLDNITKRVIGDTQIKRGMVHLRRLYSKLNVEINIDMKGFKEFKNPRLKVYNIPAYAFITEHKTVEDASEKQYDNSTWPSCTHTAADIFDHGYFNTDEIKENEVYNNISDGAFLMDDADKFTVTSKDANGNAQKIKFGYWHYETKHWGLPGVKSPNDRERMIGTTGLYSSLCPSTEKSFNNNAAMMVLTADVVSADGKFSGTADFYIHEGYCCQPNGSAATTVEDASRDFSTFRNVEYDYTVNISGMESVDTKVSSRDLSEDYYHGVGGDFYSETATRSVMVPEGGVEYDIELPDSEIYWYIESEGETFGVPLGIDPEIQRWYGGVYKYTGLPKVNADNAFYKSIRFNGELLGDAQPAMTRSAGNVISFEGSPDTHGMLYLCAVQRSLDNLVTYHTVYKFDQLGQLATPKLSMLNAPAGNLIMGIDDHSVYWKPVAGADSYTIELLADGTMGGYKVTLLPDAPAVSDGKGTKSTNVKIESETVDGQKYLKFRIRYANSAQGMLSFLQKQDSYPVTISVTANRENGESSEPGTITRTILNPIWDLRSGDWKTALQANSSGDFIKAESVITVNGLTFNAGNQEKTQYKAFGGVYGLQPGGPGNASGSRMFSLHSCASQGKIAFWTTSNSGNAGSGRYVMVDYDGSDGNALQSPDAVTKGTGKASEDFANIKITTGSFKPANWQDPAVQNVRFYNSADLVYYMIQFTPEDE